MGVIQLRAQGKRLHSGSQKALHSGRAVPTLGSTSKMQRPPFDLHFKVTSAIDRTTHLSALVVLVNG